MTKPTLPAQAALRPHDVGNRPPGETPPVPDGQRFETVLAHAEALGQRVVLEGLLAVADRLGLYARPYVLSVMFTPPTNKTRMLFTVWPEAAGMRMWVAADAFEEFFPEISADETRRQLGPADQERLLDQTAAREFSAGLERLFRRGPPSGRQV